MFCVSVLNRVALVSPPLKRTREIGSTPETMDDVRKQGSRFSIMKFSVNEKLVYTRNTVLDVRAFQELFPSNTRRAFFHSKGTSNECIYGVAPGTSQCGGWGREGSAAPLQLTVCSSTFASASFKHRCALASTDDSVPCFKRLTSAHLLIPSPLYLNGESFSKFTRVVNAGDQKPTRFRAHVFCFPERGCRNKVTASIGPSYQRSSSPTIVKPIAPRYVVFTM